MKATVCDRCEEFVDDGGLESAVIDLCARCFAALVISLDDGTASSEAYAQAAAVAGNVRVLWVEHTETPRCSSRSGRNPYAYADDPPKVPDRATRSPSAIGCEHANECPMRCPCGPGCYCRTEEGTCR